jgi:hypothetical protein
MARLLLCFKLLCHTGSHLNLEEILSKSLLFMRKSSGSWPSSRAYIDSSAFIVVLRKEERGERITCTGIFTEISGGDDDKPMALTFYLWCRHASL